MKTLTTWATSNKSGRQVVTYIKLAPNCVRRVRDAKREQKFLDKENTRMIKETLRKI